VTELAISASTLTPLTSPFSLQYLSTPAALAALIFAMPGRAEGIGGADI
jgi:hypothetical protein